MNIKKICQNLSIIYGFLMFIYFTFLTLSFLIPDSLLIDNWTESVLLISSEPKRWSVISGIEGTKLDTFTDNLMFQKLLNREQMNPIKAAMWTEGYLRYWFGILVFLRPLLLFFNYTLIRYLNVFVIFSLFFIVNSKIRNNINKSISFGFSLSLMMIHFWIFPLSLQYTPVYIIMMTSVYLLIYMYQNNRMNIKNVFLIFFMIGSLTNYFDLLTAPLLTFGIPFIIYFILMNKIIIREIMTNFMETIVLGLSWLFGYSITWFSKWVFASLILKQNVIKYSLNQILLRTGGTEEEVLNIKDILMNILNIMFPSQFKFLYIIVIFMGVLLLIINIKYKKQILSLIPLVLVGLLPFMWIFVLQNHNQHHAYFTYRILMITVFSFYSFFMLLVTSDKTKNSGEINDKFI